MKKEALLYEKAEDKLCLCRLCSHRCRIAEGEFGLCGVRQNSGGSLYTYAYGSLAAAHVDPIEKKPLYHFLPGTSSYSVASIGCNFRCGFCQNWQISQQSFRETPDFKGLEMAPAEIAQEAKRQGCRSISYTYTEPTIFFEYALETAMLAKKEGLRNCFVTNGYMTEQCIRMIAPYLDAANIDLKFFRESSYKRICGAGLEPVLDSIRLMRKLNIWVELTTLLIPGENDSEEEISGIAEFILGVDKNIPWHISRFHPDYEFSGRRATSVESIKKAHAIGVKAGLRFIYAGNLYGWGSTTFCPGCAKPLIKREGFDILEDNTRQARCVYCESVIPGIF